MKKIIAWYFLGFVLWFLAFAFLAATSDLKAMIFFNFITLTIGLFIGLILKNQFINKPWLIILIPILHLVLGFFA